MWSNNSRILLYTPNLRCYRNLQPLKWCFTSPNFNTEKTFSPNFNTRISPNFTLEKHSPKIPQISTLEKQSPKFQHWKTFSLKCYQHWITYISCTFPEALKKAPHLWLVFFVLRHFWSYCPFWFVNEDPCPCLMSTKSALSSHSEL